MRFLEKFICRFCGKEAENLRKDRPRTFCSNKCKGAYTSSLVVENIESRKKIRGGCWEYTGYLDGEGYGIIGLKRKLWKVHRLFWTLSNGEIPAGKKILHRCDNPRCFNLAHLFLGTQADNIRDMMEKGRNNHPKGRYGEASTNRRLTNLKVLEMRKIREEKSLPYHKIARLYKISTMTAYRAITKQSWPTT